VDPVLAPKERIAEAINAAYQRQEGQAAAFIEHIEREDVIGDLGNLSSTATHEDLLDTAGRAQVIKLVNLMIFEAVKQEASDIHVQPGEQRLAVRMRIDGVLFDAFELPGRLHEEIASRIKVMGEMNIAEKRLPQDGRATVQLGDRLIDLRISTVPTSFGERIVIRLLDKSARLYELSELGMDPTTLNRFRRLIGLEHGLLLVTGPTGSGKSTTLYGALQEINSDEKNVMTLEDPIEYQLPGISQSQVAEKKGMTFADGLRSVLRQDPDIIMVGEIRDRDTAVMGIQSALTGHLVFSTLHTNDAASAVTRLLDLGIEPYLVASSVVGVLAQRLVRKVCPHCAQPYQPDAEELRELGAEEATGPFYKGEGCEHCRGTGYRGRVGVFELLTVEESVRNLIQERATAGQIKDEAARHGMKTIIDDGRERVAAGVTSTEEVIRVTTRATT
jgi:general secretion pathway protein E